MSRTCILAIIASKGKELPPGTIEVMIRWGGWQAVTGAKTVLRIYARKVIDKNLDPYSLSLGHELSDKEWEVKKKECLGVPRWPVEPIVDRGRSSLPLQVRLHVWRSQRWMGFHKALNEICAKMMAAALSDQEIMPVTVNRYRQVRRAFSVFVSERGNSELVQNYLSLLAMRQRVWSICVKEAIDACKFAFFRDGMMPRPEKYLQGRRFLELLENVQIGHVGMDSRVVQDVGEDDAGLDAERSYRWRAL